VTVYELVRDRVWARVLAGIAGVWVLTETGLRSWRALGSPGLVTLAGENGTVAGVLSALTGRVVADTVGDAPASAAALVIGALVLLALEQRGHLRPAGSPAPRPR
jgi:hypothetical protein